MVPLVEVTEFPLTPRAIEAFDLLKKDLAQVGLQAIDEDAPFMPPMA